jgi:hypothetical protein
MTDLKPAVIRPIVETERNDGGEVESRRDYCVFAKAA